MRVRRWRGLMLVMLLGCGGDSGISATDARTMWAETLCRIAEECGCAAGAAGGCTVDNVGVFRDWQLAAEKAGLRFDGDCFEQVIDQFEESGCSLSPGDGSSLGECHVWSGDLQEGEACDYPPVPFSSRCADGRRCINGACLDDFPELPTAGEGEACFDGSEQTAVCEAGQRCDFFGTNTCVPIPGIGESCAGGLWCGTDAYCDQTNTTCAPHKADGEACTEYFECTIDCLDGVCDPDPPLACLYTY